MNKKTVAIVLAAGSGKRMNQNIPKQYLCLKEKPLLYYSLKKFQDSFIDEIILVVGAGEESYCKTEIVNKYHLNKVKRIMVGGKQRYHSVMQGLKAITNCEYVMIHDGARPFLTQTIINEAYLNVEKYKACVAGMPVKDTIKIVNENQIVQETPCRNVVWQVQTPQCFSFPLIFDAYTELMKKEEELLEKGISITDDAMVVETFTDVPIKLFEGSYLNIKITTPEDLLIGETFFST